MGGIVVLSPTEEALWVIYLMLAASALSFYAGYWYARENPEPDQEVDQVEESSGPDPPPGDPSQDVSYL